MKLLITGGVGFIGTNISLEARRRGYDVIAFDSLIRSQTERNIPPLTQAGVQIVRGDVRAPHDFLRLPRGIDAIIHLAGNPGIPWSIAWPYYDFDVNTTGTINVLEYSKSIGKSPVIFASTNKVYSDYVNEVGFIERETRYEWDISGFIMGGISEMGVREDFPLDGFGKYPRSPYGVSKTAADLYCQEYFHLYGIPTVVNRMSCIYGYYQLGVEDQGWIDWFVRSILLGDGSINIYGNGKQVRDILFGTDVANLYLTEIEQIEKVKGSVFNIGGGFKNTLSLREAITMIEEYTGKKVSLTYHPWRHADQKIYISDTSKAEEALGWKQTVTPKEGIIKMIEAYKGGMYEA